MGCSPRQARYARERLRALGYVSWKTGSKRYSTANQYTLYPRGDGPGKSDSNSAPPAGMKRPGKPDSNSAPPAEMKRPEKGFHSAPPAPRPGHHLPSDQGTTCPPQRTSNRETVTEKYRGKFANGCSHPDTAVCPRCLMATVVSKPVSPP